VRESGAGRAAPVYRFSRSGARRFGLFHRIQLQGHLPTTRLGGNHSGQAGRIGGGIGAPAGKRGDGAPTEVVEVVEVVEVIEVIQGASLLPSITSPTSTPSITLAC
jgi:hypothetical protein